jgi:hypothetical protein
MRAILRLGMILRTASPAPGESSADRFHPKTPCRDLSSYREREKVTREVALLPNVLGLQLQPRISNSIDSLFY